MKKDHSTCRVVFWFSQGLSQIYLSDCPGGKQNSSEVRVFFIFVVVEPRSEQDHERALRSDPTKLWMISTKRIMSE